MLAENEEGLRRAFERLAAALAARDVEAFRELAVRDLPPQEDLFVANAEKVAAQGWTLRATALELRGEVGQVSFDICDAQGRCVDASTVTFSDEGDGWRLRSF